MMQSLVHINKYEMMCDIIPDIDFLYSSDFRKSDHCPINRVMVITTISKAS